MPGFDTYKGIERYAKDPYSSINKLCFLTLLKRARDLAVWNTVTTLGAENIKAGMLLFTGAIAKTEAATSDTTNTVTSVDDLIAMSIEDQDKMFTSICQSVGVSIDPSTLMNIRQQK